MLSSQPWCRSASSDILNTNCRVQQTSKADCIPEDLTTLKTTKNKTKVLLVWFRYLLIKCLIKNDCDLVMVLFNEQICSLITVNYLLISKYLHYPFHYAAVDYYSLIRTVFTSSHFRYFFHNSDFRLIQTCIMRKPAGALFTDGELGQE